MRLALPREGGDHSPRVHGLRLALSREGADPDPRVHGLRAATAGDPPGNQNASSAVPHDRPAVQRATRCTLRPSPVSPPVAVSTGCTPVCRHVVGVARRHSGRMAVTAVCDATGALVASWPGRGSDGSVRAALPHSSRGPGRRPLKAEITGSNPVCGTNRNSRRPRSAPRGRYLFGVNRATTTGGDGARRPRSHPRRNEPTRQSASRPGNQPAQEDRWNPRWRAGW